VGLLKLGVGLLKLGVGLLKLGVGLLTHATQSAASQTMWSCQQLDGNKIKTLVRRPASNVS
jgi:hypothetical protein